MLFEFMFWSYAMKLLPLYIFLSFSKKKIFFHFLTFMDTHGYRRVYKNPWVVGFGDIHGLTGRAWAGYLTRGEGSS